MAQEIGDNNLIDTWASGGTKVEPSPTKKNTGWVLGEKPPHEFMNYLQSEFGKQINYLIRAGIPAHGTTTPYTAGSVVTQAGFIWIALSANTNSVPSLANSNWLQIPTKAQIDDALALAAPPGAVQNFARNTAPTGWLKANGAAVSRATYPALFSAIGTTFGAGNGTTTFNLPDLRGEFVRGWDDGRGVDVGRLFGTTQGQSIQSHNHGVPADIGNNVTPSARVNTTTNNAATQTISTSDTGGLETRPRNIALLVCIKF